MRLSRKLLLMLSITWIVLLAIISLGVYQILREKFLRAEEFQISKNVARLNNAINDELRSLSSFTLDWSPWDEAYKFIEGRNPDFIKNNLQVSTLKNTGVNLMSYYDKNAKMLIGIYADLDAEKIIPYPEDLKNFFNANSVFFKKATINDTVTGLILLPTRIMLIASAGVTNSVRSLPLNGYMINGKALDIALMNKISKKIELEIKLYLLTEIYQNAALKKIYETNIKNEKIAYIERVNKDISSAYVLLYDVYQNPIGMIQVNQHRIFYNAGTDTIKYFLASFLMLCILSALIIWYFLKKIIINRLGRLKHGITNITEKQDYNHPITTDGDDEISFVGHQINTMLATIDQSQKNMQTVFKALKESETRFRDSFNNAAIGMSLVTLEGKFIEVNKALCDIVGYSEAELLQLDFQTITYKDDLEADLNRVSQLLAGKIQAYTLEKRYVKKNGEILWILLSVSLVRDADTHEPLYFVSQIEDIDIRKKYESELKEKAYHDSLTGLANREFLQISFDKMFNEAINFHKKAALLFIDLDYFKEVNDQFGHEGGDILLKAIAARLQSICHPTDIIARLGGDEFVIVITHEASIDSLETIVNRILQSLSEPYVIHHQNVKISISIGVSLYDDDAAELQALLINADKALYYAKAHSRGSYQFFKKHGKR